MSVSFTSTFPPIIGTAGGYLTLTFDESSFANFDADFDSALITTSIEDLDPTEKAKYTVGAWTVDPNNKLVYSALIQYSDVGDVLHPLRAYYDIVPGTVHHFRRQDAEMKLTVDDIEITDASGTFLTNDHAANAVLTFEGLTDLPADASDIEVTAVDEFGREATGFTYTASLNGDQIDVLLNLDATDIVRPTYTVTFTYHHLTVSFDIRQTDIQYLSAPADIITETKTGVAFAVRVTDAATRYGTISAKLVDSEGADIPGATAPTVSNGLYSFTTDLPATSYETGEDGFGLYRVYVQFTGTGFSHIEAFEITYQGIVLSEAAGDPVVDGSQTSYDISLTTNVLAADPGTGTVAVVGGSDYGNFSAVTKTDNGDSTYTYAFTYYPTGPGDQTIQFTLGGSVVWEKVIGYVAPHMVVLSTDSKFNPRTFYARQDVKLERSEPLIGEYKDGVAILQVETALTNSDDMYVELTLSPVEDIQNGTAEWFVYKVLGDRHFRDNSAFVTIDVASTGLRFRSAYSGITNNDYSAHGYSWRYRGRIV